MDKHDFDYTPRMIALQEREMSMLKKDNYSYFDNPSPIIDGLKKVGDHDPFGKWPGGFGDEKLCSDCVHWRASYKTHGVKGCEIKDTHYCLAHDKCYWKKKGKNEFLTEEDFDL